MAKAKTTVRRVYITKKKARRRNGFTIPLAVALPFVSIGADTYEDIQNQGFKDAMQWLLAKFTGYYPQANYPDWRIRHMKHGALLVGVGYGVHWVASKFGVNRALARTGIPIIRI